MGKKLVIGSAGQIGTELIHALTKIYGQNQVVATDIYPKHKGIHNGILFLKMDVLDADHLASIVKEHEISEVYLLAALLSAVSESKILPFKEKRSMVVSRFCMKQNPAA